MHSLSNSCLSAEWSLTGAHVTTISSLLLPRAWMNRCVGTVIH